MSSASTGSTLSSDRPVVLSDAGDRPESSLEDMNVFVVSGDPIVGSLVDAYRSTLAEAGEPDWQTAVPPSFRPINRSAFHVVVDPIGRPVAVSNTTLGKIDELSLAPYVDPMNVPAGLICECPSIAVLPEGRIEGLTELLYRSMYTFARRQGARWLMSFVDTLTLTLFRDEGIMFRALGRVTTHQGFEAVVIGEELRVIEGHLARARPEFLAFLTEAFTDEERVRFELP